MSVSLSFVGNAFQFFTNGGAPLNGGLLYTYSAGTSTPAATYADSLGSVPNSNPIVLSSSGRLPAEVWMTDGIAYKFVLTDSLGNLIATYDNLYGGLGAMNSLISGATQYVSVVGGTANVITLSPTVVATSYYAGMSYTFIPTAGNTGGVTVNVSGLGAVILYNITGHALLGNELVTNGLYLITYQSAIGGFILMNSNSGSGTYTPVWASSSGSAPAIGDGTITGSYTRNANLCTVNIQLAFGASTTYGSSGTWNFTLPIPYLAVSAGIAIMQSSAFFKLAAGGLFNPTVGNNTTWSLITDSDPTHIRVQDGNGTIGFGTGAWGNGGAFRIIATYPVLA